MASLTYFSHIRQKGDHHIDSLTYEYTNNSRKLEQKHLNPLNHAPSSQELKQFIGCKAREVIKQMRAWGYNQVTLNIPENWMSVKTEQGLINFQLLSDDAIIGNVRCDYHQSNVVETGIPEPAIMGLSETHAKKPYPV